MVTTFFGPHALGGDAVYVDRLARALLRRGHEVEVVHCADAFATVSGGVPPAPYTPPEGLRVHTLRTRAAALSALWTHQTGGPGPKAALLDRLLAGGRFDVVHFHNISLLGGPGLLQRAARVTGARRVMTAHEHWLVCPLSLLWKLDRRPCERPQCGRCTVHARRPPQVWRRTGRIERGVRTLDLLLTPTETAARTMRDRGIDADIVALPHFLPADWAGGEPAGPEVGDERPYIAAAGRLVREKGFEELVAAMARLPDVDLRLAGAGALEGRLRELAAGLPNVTLLGRREAPELAALFAGARAVVVPSLFHETFGFVTLEAAWTGTPVIVRRRGALPEVAARIGGSIAFDGPDELVAAIRRVVDDPALRDRLGAQAREGARREGDEERHVSRYLGLVAAAA